MKIFTCSRLLFTITILGVFGCNQNAVKTGNRLLDRLPVVKNNKLAMGSFPLTFTVSPPPDSFAMPALHSFADANYNGLWVFIGGKKNGFHGTSNNPPPFRATTANDSIWVIDFAGKHSWGVPVPAAYYLALTASNPQFCQTANSLYMCGGYTRTDISKKLFNTTSNYFFEFNLPALIQYVQSGGAAPSLSQVITKVIKSPYVQVTGGELLHVNDYFYLIGGQNYDAIYSSGRTGIYTNAVRKFNVQRSPSSWIISDTLSVIDTVNLHRRDMNVVYYPNNSLAVLYGGVFTAKDEAYLTAVTIGGLASGKPVIMVDSTQQIVNQYTCAKANIVFGIPYPTMTVLFGGITYKEYNPQTGKLVIGDHGVPMPFSNIVSMIYKLPALSLLEYIQIPPNAPLLPQYMGSNGLFIPLPQYLLAGHNDMLDARKIAGAMTGPSIMIGYIYGGIISMGPTSGTTVNGYVATYANPILYQVYLNVPTMH